MTNRPLVLRYLSVGIFYFGLLQHKTNGYFGNTPMRYKKFVTVHGFLNTDSWGNFKRG
jgi:hypothetical protein